MMGSAGGGRINKPKAAFCKKDVRKETKMKIKALKRLTARGHSEHTLESTTKDMLRQTRTNPKANVHLSGKKKRLLMKEAKRLMAASRKMEEEVVQNNINKARKESEHPLQMETA